jgi:hypothetical protein
MRHPGVLPLALVLNKLEKTARCLGKASQQGTQENCANEQQAAGPGFRFHQ